MPICTELMAEKYIDLFQDVDIIQIGARNMQNFDLLKAVGKLNKPILLKRGLANTIQEWLSGFAGDVAGDDNNLTKYLNYTQHDMASEGVVVSMSFRWDFLAYSGIGVALGSYFSIFRNFRDQYYQWIFNIYLICNSFWVLIIRAPYSNRFAQISWFILPLVLIYPFMRERFWVNQERMLAAGILLFYAYGFYFNILPLLLN